MLAHKNHTKDFKDLNYSEQAKSINALMSECSKAMRAHLRLAQADGHNVANVKAKCVAQASRLLNRVKNL